MTGIFQPELFGSSLAALLVLLLPGWALLSVLPARASTASNAPAGKFFSVLLADLADAAALSVAISALLGMWFFVAGLRLDAWLLVGLYAACLLVILLQALRRGLLQWDRDKILPIALQAGLGVLLLLALVAWRFYQARNLALPAWVDSVHHALIVRAIAEYGGVPPSLAPYISIPFYYHYGFHLMAALFGAAANLPAAQSVLWLGQVINALAALAVYRVGYAIFPTHEGLGWLGRGAPRAVLAALLVGFAFQMPAYYLSWGRYTLLAGLLVLGPAMAAAHELYIEPGNRAAAVRLGLLLAGICMVHYLALLLLLLLLLVLGLAGLLRAIHFSRLRPTLRWRELPWALVVASLVGLLLAAPWVWRVFSFSQTALNAGTRITLPDNAISDLAAWGKDFEYLILMLGPRHSHVLLILAAVGLLFALRKPGLRVLAAWAGLLIVLDLPWGVRLGPFRPDHYAIVQFFPASLFLADLLFSGGAAVEQVLHGPGRRWLSAGLLLAAAGGLLAWGLRETRSVVNSTTNFTNTSDVAALEWVKTNTPQTARFLINTTLWQGQVYRGVDGGYWLAPYAGPRASQLPPALYSAGDTAYVQQITDWARRASQMKGCTPEFWDLMRDADLTYVYLRSGVGNLQPENLADCPRLRKIYQRAGVFIYEVIRP